MGAPADLPRMAANIGGGVPQFGDPGAYAAQLTIKVLGGRRHQSRVKHFRME